MGNANSSTEEPLAIIAMAREFGLERRHIVVLRDSLRSHANADFMVSKEYFDHALKDAKVSDPKQIQLFDLLFTMWDYKGNNMIHYKDFCIAVSPLACPYDDIDSIINFTLLIGCETMDGKVNAEELHNILECISSVASCLGDEMLDAGDIELVVEAVFECVDEDMLVPHAVCARSLKTNAYIRRFASGKRGPLDRFGEEISVVTEHEYDQLDAQLLSESKLASQLCR